MCALEGAAAAALTSDQGVAPQREEAGGITHESYGHLNLISHELELLLTLSCTSAV